MIEIFKALGTGLLVGIIFGMFSLPIPAPVTLSGIMGIVGIFIGYLIVQTS